MRTNAERAHSAWTAVQHYVNAEGLHDQSFDENLTDLLTDLRHYADEYGMDFDDAVRSSANHHYHEIAEA